MRGAFALILVIVALVAVALLERDRWVLSAERITLGTTPATLWQPPKPLDGAPLVVIAHGFAGSQQLMEDISRDLAHAGFAVLAFDFLGHGRNTVPLSGDVTVVEGATARLVDQTVAVAEAAVLQTGAPGLVLIGHSMATDVIVRASQRLPGVAATIAISMYSEAVTATFPPRLLIVSGEWESRLREVAMDAVRMVAPDAIGGETVTQDGVTRRAVAAPNVEHVGVLYSAFTQGEIRRWIGDATGLAPRETPAPDWPLRLALLVALVLLFRPLTQILPQRPRIDAVSLRAGEMVAVLALPIIPAAAVTWFFIWSPTGIAGFAGLSAFFATWGAVQLLLLWWFGTRPVAPVLGGMVLLTFGALVFAFALDRYGAAFVPVGPRWGEMAVLLIGTVPLMLADTLIGWRAPWWQRVLVHVVLLVVLASLMIAAPARLGLMFTVLPVLVLFWGVFGTMGAWVARRQGAETAALPLALILAWSIAASTPIFAG